VRTAADNVGADKARKFSSNGLSGERSLTVRVLHSKAGLDKHLSSRSNTFYVEDLMDTAPSMHDM
jgi:hypothetical protein